MCNLFPCISRVNAKYLWLVLKLSLSWLYAGVSAHLVMGSGDRDPRAHHYPVKSQKYLLRESTAAREKHGCLHTQWFIAPGCSSALSPWLWALTSASCPLPALLIHSLLLQQLFQPSWCNLKLTTWIHEIEEGFHFGVQFTSTPSSGQYPGSYWLKPKPWAVALAF